MVPRLPNWTPFLTFHLALTMIGAVTVNIPIVYREYELTRILELTEAKALVPPVRFRGHDFRAMGAALVEELGAGYISSGYRDGMGFPIIIVVLIFRPTGLFARAERIL